MTESSETYKTIDWLSNGGTTLDGLSYLAPKYAKPWGEIGCPIVPRHFRLEFGDLLISSNYFSNKDEDFLRLSDLDASAHFHVDLEKNSNLIIAAVTGLNYKISKVSREIAIPAGMPLIWLMNLPLSSRVLRVISLLYLDRGWKDISNEPVDCGEIFDRPNFGKKCLLEFLTVLESAENNEYNFQLDDQNRKRLEIIESIEEVLANDYSPDNAVAVEFLTNKLIDKLFPSQILRQFASWGLAETNATSVGEALKSFAVEEPKPKEFIDFFNIKLKEFTHRPNHAYVIINDWLLSLPIRKKFVFDFRNFPAEGRERTLIEIGGEFNVSRARIGQIEKKVSEEFSYFLDSQDAKPIWWRCESIKKRIGVAAPENTIETLLQPPDGVPDYRHVVLELAGIGKEEGWYYLKSKKSNDPILDVNSMVDEYGCINMELLSDSLNEWGLVQSLHEAWVHRSEQIMKMPSGRFYLRGKSIGDRMVSALADIGHPTSVNSLIARVTENRAISSVKNSLSADSRVVRVNKHEWGLASWKISEYENVASAIRKYIEENGGHVNINQLTLVLNEKFKIKETTTLNYCNYAPLFVTEGDYVRLRKFDEVYEFCKNLMSKSAGKGVFDLGNGQITLLTEVTDNLARGSGSQLPTAIGAILNIRPNDCLEFHDFRGNKISITFPETSIMGPILSSVRSTIELSKSEVGDWLSLNLNVNDMTYVATSTRLDQHQRGWELISRLTGINVESELDGLANALNCKVNSVRAILAKRGDFTVKNALPKDEVPDLLNVEFENLEQYLSNREK